MFPEGIWFHSKESLLHFTSLVFVHALLFNELSLEPGSTVTVLSNVWT